MHNLFTFDIELTFAVFNAGICTPLPLLTFSVCAGITSFLLQGILLFPQISNFQNYSRRLGVDIFQTVKRQG